MAERSSGRNKTRRLQEKVLEHLRESGNVSYACKRTGVGRQTFYDWKDNNGAFELEAEAAIAFGKEFVNDLAHTKLIQNINEGDFRAVKFQLVSRHPDYQPKRPRDPYRDEVINSPVTEIQIVPATGPFEPGQLGHRMMELGKAELEKQIKYNPKALAREHEDQEAADLEDEAKEPKDHK